MLNIFIDFTIIVRYPMQTWGCTPTCERYINISTRLPAVKNWSVNTVRLTIIPSPRHSKLLLLRVAIRIEPFKWTFSLTCYIAIHTDTRKNMLQWLIFTNIRWMLLQIVLVWQTMLGNQIRFKMEQQERTAHTQLFYTDKLRMLARITFYVPHGIWAMN